MAYTREGFVSKYGEYIFKATKGTGILPGTLVAQAILESSGSVSGKWLVGGSTLSRKANNYFGIKCHNWKGRVYNIDTNEQTSSGSTYVDKNACFRAYNSVKDSIDDYIKFLQENSNYKKHGVFSAKTVKEQAERLKASGYATAVNYASTVYDVYKSIADELKVISEKIQRKNKMILYGSLILLTVTIITAVSLSRKKA